MVIQIINTLAIPLYKKILGTNDIKRYTIITAMIWVAIVALSVYIFLIPVFVETSVDTDYNEKTIKNDIDNTDNDVEVDNDEDEDEDSTLSPAELLVEQNFDLIQQLKASYSDEDTMIFESDFVDFGIYEKAGYIYQDLMKTGDYEMLRGECITSCKIAIIDSDSDETIYWLDSGQYGDANYWPGNNNKFYCVVFHDDYDIYVSPPIRAVGGESYRYVEIILDRKNGQEFTPLFQFCVYLRNLEAEEEYSMVSDEYWCNFELKNVLSNCEGGHYSVPISDSRIVSNGIYTYFSLNTNYVMDISLSHNNDFSHKSASQTVDGSVTNSNLIDIYLEFDSEKDILE